MYMDTDTFVIYIETEDVFEDFDKILKEWLDTSEYDKNLNRSMTTRLNKKIIGRFKDELLGMIVNDFITIRLNVYGFSYIEDGIKEQKKCKGTAKYIVKSNINFETLKQTPSNNQTFMKKQPRFRWDKLVIHTEIFNKKALYNQDNNRLRTFDGISLSPKNL